MESLGKLRVDATIENLRIILSFLQGVGYNLALTEKSQFDIELAVEEAIVNIITHGYGPDQRGEIGVEVAHKDDIVYVYLTDWGMTFDPKQKPPFDPDEPIELRAEGGMGIHFILTLTDSIEYEPATKPGGSNRLTLIKHVERLQAGTQLPSALRELNAMLKISESMAADINLDELLELIVRNLMAVVEATGGTLYLVDYETGELVSRVLVDGTNSLKEIRLKLGTGIAGHVAETGELVNIRNAYDDPNFTNNFDQITGRKSTTILAMPIFSPNQKIIGVVQLINKRNGTFTTRDERLLTAMAAQAAISIEVSRLHDREIQQQLIDQELQTARSIQKSFLPHASPKHDSWDMSAQWHPVREVAGDFYDFHRLPDGRLAVVIADVSGKGIPAALFMALTVTVLRFAMSLNLSPEKLLDRANQSIIANQQSRMFVTAFIVYIDMDGGALEIANAGHNPPLVYRAATETCEYITLEGTAIGIFKRATYEHAVIDLSPGDIMALYTDGITEIINEVEEEYGEERLESLLIANAELSADEITKRILDDTSRFAGDKGIFDDETMVIIKRL